MIPDMVKDSNMVERVSISEVWRQMEKCKYNSLTRAIGVMNCPVLMLLEILTFAHVRPAINCLEIHPFNTQEETIAFHKKLNIPVAAFAPMCPSQCPNCPQKDLNLLQDSTIRDIAKK
jgi:diketogulonate reductase-like aldo/keto reductase